jgi:microcystin-dependent protein
MTIPYPTDPSLPSNPAPLFSDSTAARGDHLRANNAEIWANFTEIVETILGNASLSTDGTFASVVDTLFPSVKAAKTYVETRISDHDSQHDDRYVRLTQNQTIAGIKTFSSIPVLPSSDPSTVNQAARKGYVDGRIPIGAILMFGLGSAPDNYLKCDGSAVSRTTYAALFSVIGTAYGAGNGSSTFNLPNYNAVVPKGAGSQTINGRSKSGPAFAAMEEDRMQGHNHDLYVKIGERTFTTAGGGTDVIINNSTLNTILASDNPNSVRNPKTDGTNGTPRTGATTRENSLGTTFIIRYQ